MTASEDRNEAKIAADKKAASPKSDRKPFSAELETLRALEKSIDGAFVSYAKVLAERADGHPTHAAHNNQGEYARREIGRAHGGVVQAIQALETFVGKHEVAEKSHDEAEQAKVDKLEAEESESAK